MKKFLLIIAVATAGFIPQLALCNPAQSLIDVTNALGYYNAKMAGVDPARVMPPEASTGQEGHWETVTLACGKQKQVFVGGDKIMHQTYAGGNAEAAL